MRLEYIHIVRTTRGPNKATRSQQFTQNITEDISLHKHQQSQLHGFPGCGYLIFYLVEAV